MEADGSDLYMVTFSSTLVVSILEACETWWKTVTTSLLHHQVRESLLCWELSYLCFLTMPTGYLAKDPGRHMLTDLKKILSA